MEKRANRRRKPEWITEIVADRDEWVEFLGTDPQDSALAHVGISRATWTAISQGQRPRVALACYRLASFARHGALSDLLGSAWREFFVCGDTLAFPGLKYPLSASQLRSTWFRVQDSARLRSEVSMLRHQVAAECSALAEAGKFFDWRRYAYQGVDSGGDGGSAGSVRRGRELRQAD